MPNKNIKNKEFIAKDLARENIPTEDSNAILDLFEKYFFNLEYEGIVFALQAIKELDLENTRGFTVKNVIKEKDYKFNLNGQTFNRQYSIISDSEFKNAFEKAKKQNTINMLNVEMNPIECFDGFNKISEENILKLIVNTLNVFVESYTSPYLDFQNNKFHFVQTVWFYDGRKLLKASGFDILKHL